VSKDLATTVVRGFGYEITHVVTVPRTIFEPMAWPGPAHTFTGIQTPIVARCGNNVRSCQPVLIVMEPGSLVKCRHCARVTGIIRQAEDMGLELEHGPNR
jgi:hypothetical protein